MQTQTIVEASTLETKFLCANSTPTNLAEIQQRHIIPVFVKDNQATISQADFMQTAADIAADIFGEQPSDTAVRVSHPIKGRTFEARNKKAADLLDYEKTIYFERMAFVLEFPIRQQLAGQELSLMVAGVKAYNMDNLYNTLERTTQSFKIAVGFKVSVCTNLCTFTDGAALDIKVRSLDELGQAINALFSQYNQDAHIEAMQQFGDYELSENQFATLIGKTRLYQHLPNAAKKEIPELLISDTQVNTVARQYYRDDNFRKNPNGSINLWNMYNLLTDAVKSSYIDTFLDRNLNAFSFTEGIARTLDGREEYDWFLN